MKLSIFAVVVTYMPDVDALIQLCRRLSNSASVIVVDNTPDESLTFALDGCQFISNGENLGIAAAQNKGIKEALCQGADAVALFDQDSAVSDLLLPNLVAALKEIGTGVVVPVCMDASKGNEYPSFRLNKLGWPQPIYSGSCCEPVGIDMAISSGTLISSGVFAKAGLMDESLFIDYVDFEWCARVKMAGFGIFVVPKAIMNHMIGEASFQSAGLNVIVHGPIRCYYRVRNAFHLFRYKHIRFLYAIHQLLAALVHHLLQWRHSKNPRLHLKMGLLGVWHGLTGRRGRIGL